MPLLHRGAMDGLLKKGATGILPVHSTTMKSKDASSTGETPVAPGHMPVAPVSIVAFRSAKAAGRRFYPRAAEILLLLLALTACISAAAAAEPANDRLDWTAWRELPVHDSGRVMPLDTFARRLAERLCGRANPRLAPADAVAEEQAGEAASDEPNPLFPGNVPRKFTAPELLFSWLVEPEQWHDVPFLAARHESLRRDALDVPLIDRHGNRVKFVSPREYEQSQAARAWLDDLARREREARDANRRFELSPTDRLLAELNEAYGNFLLLTFDPQQPATDRAAFSRRLMEVLTAWRRGLEPALAPLQGPGETTELGRIATRLDEGLIALLESCRKEPCSATDAERHVTAVCRAADELAEYFAQAREKAFEKDDEGREAIPEEARAGINTIAVKTAELARLAHALRESLYDSGHALRVVPALHPFALGQGGEPNAGEQPWLALQTLLFASDDLLSGYPADQVARARQAFVDAGRAYVDRAAPDRAARFNRAMRDFAESLRSLGEAVEPERRELLAGDVDEDLLAATAYPPLGAMNRELLYNRLDPFFWSWVLTAASMLCVVLGVGPARKPMFFVGAAVLAAGQGFTIAGLWLRGSITGMVPVANMYETVLFVAATVALFGLWFAMLPLIWPVLGAAWRVTALAPTPAEAAVTGLAGDDARWLWRTMPVFRGLLTVAFFYLLAIRHLNPAGDGPIFPLLPSMTSGTAAGLVGAVVIWLVGLAVLAWSLWFLPRALLTLAIGIALVPKAVWMLLRHGLSEPIDRAVARRSFLLAGAAVALLAYLLAHYVPGPVFDREVGLSKMNALLRSNLWLTLHVLIITASYGAGGLAWGLANLSLLYYALGRYHAPKGPSEAAIQAGHRPAGDYHAPESAFTRRPPEVCGKLANYIYKCIQMSVLLLAAGTITGAIWADYAWGRYWGWDPKEVWALISLMVYLAVLHGRWAGWTGNFGMAVGGVFG
ncbi:MAG: cytochrome c biogenesis protein CcsA, partial [Pirellulaceae bacterium]|nr:cytochrome c biogenesis protein CcsA [Pirellulaceae bacterium]